MENTILQKEKELIENFSLLEEWENKYEYILDYSKKMPLISEELKTEDNLVKGCQSKVWLHATIEQGIIRYFADSDGEIPKGLTAMLIEILNNNTQENIIESEITFLKETEIIYHLSPNRVKGINSVIARMKELAKITKNEK